MNTNSKIDSNHIQKAAEEYGFNLEFDTSRVLEDCGYSCELNKLQFCNDKIIELDVVAKKEIPPLTLLVECKGTQKNSCLILVKASPERLANDTLDNDVQRYNIEGSEYKIVAYQNENDHSSYTITGDFFSLKNDKLVKASKNDDKNNFYKAQKQLLDAINGYKDTTVPKDVPRHFLGPLIVTNAQIWVIEYVNNSPIVSLHKGVLHRVVNDHPKLPIGISTTSNIVSSFMIPVINRDYLKEILLRIEEKGDCNKVSLGKLELEIGVD